MQQDLRAYKKKKESFWREQIFQKNRDREEGVDAKNNKLRLNWAKISSSLDWTLLQSTCIN